METAVPGDIQNRTASRIAIWEWCGLLVSAVILIAIRLHAFDLPLETDECNYAYIGNRLLAGDMLYRDVWDHQPPGIFVLFAGVIALFGDGVSVFRWMSCLFSVASMIFVFAIVRRCGGQWAAIFAAFLFALVSADPGTAGEGCNREIIMNAFILGAWYCAIRGLAVEKPGQNSLVFLLMAGVCLAVASLIKTIVAVQWVFLAGWCVVVAYRIGGADVRWRQCAKALACLGAGPLVFWLFTFGYFAVTDRWAAFVDAVFLFNLGYSGGGDAAYLARFVQFFAAHGHPFKFDSALPLWIITVVSLLWLVVARSGVRGHRHILAVFLLFVSGYIAVCLPARFWPHYYYLLVPPAVIVVAIAVAQLVEILNRRFLLSAPAAARLSYALYVVVPLLLFQNQYDAYLSQPSFGITVKRYNSRDFWGRAHGQNIRHVTDPDDTLFVFGNEAEFYYYAKRRCASRYTMITALQQGYAGAEQKRATLMAELESTLPRVIVVLFDEKPFDGWLRFLEKYYGEAVGVDRHDKTGEPIMLVFARKDQPIESIDWNWDRKSVGGWMLGESPPRP